jgi:hypothetical protein
MVAVGAMLETHIGSAPVVGMKPIYVACETCWSAPFKRCTSLDYDESREVKHYHKDRVDRAGSLWTLICGTPRWDPDTKDLTTEQTVELIGHYIKALEQERDELLAELPPLTQIASTA